MSDEATCPACGPNAPCTCTNVERERWDLLMVINRLRTENASLLARLEQAERDNDALRGQLATRTEALQTANATVAATRADRDAWKARAERSEAR